MIQLFLNNQDLQKQTGASTKPGMDAASQSAQDINGFEDIHAAKQ